MNKTIGLALLIGGIVLMIFGINASESLASDISRTFTGAPTDKSLGLLIGGVVMAVVGLIVSARNSKT